MKKSRYSIPFFMHPISEMKLDVLEGCIDKKLDLNIYPNPSRDVFNITFTSERVQDLRVRVMNIIGEGIIIEELEQYIGEYTKQINLEDNAKGIYFLEIETNDGVINKKLILQQIKKKHEITS